MGGVFARIDAWQTSLLLAALMFTAWELGLRWGRRRRAESAEPASDKFEEAGMALLGLLLAFTFSMSLGKHDHRREMLVADSNAIGDFYTCASLLKEPVRPKLQSVIRDYAALRLDAARHPASLEGTLKRFDEMHGRMTALVAQALEGGTPIASPLVLTLNAVTSSQAARLASLRDRLPSSIVWLLYLSAVVSTGLIGRRQGMAGKRQLAGLLTYILIVALVVYVILDLNQPNKGLITLDQEPMERLLGSMEK